MAVMRSFLLVAVVLLAVEVTHAQVVHSTTGGGAWNEITTWTEGRLPTATDSVVIRGPVWLEDSVAVAALTITAYGHLEGRAPTAAVSTSRVYNSGTLEAASHLTLILTDTAATLFNEGTWHTTRLWIHANHVYWNTQTFVQSDTVDMGAPPYVMCEDQIWELEADWRLQTRMLQPRYFCGLQLKAGGHALYFSGTFWPFYGFAAHILDATAFVATPEAWLGLLSFESEQEIQFSGSIHLIMTRFRQPVRNLDTMWVIMPDFYGPFYNEGSVIGRDSMDWWSEDDYGLLKSYHAIYNQGHIDSLILLVYPSRTLPTRQLVLSPEAGMTDETLVQPYTEDFLGPREVVLTGDNFIPAFALNQFDLDPSVRVRFHIPPGSSLTLDRILLADLQLFEVGGDLSAFLINQGRLTVRRFPVAPGRQRRTNWLEIKGATQHATITLHEQVNSRPPYFDQALPIWWRFEATDTTLRADTLVFTPPEDIREGLYMDSIYVFHSPDGVSGWRLLSRIWDHPYGESVVVVGAPLHGVYVLAPRSGSIAAVMRPVNLQLISMFPGGLRVGGPNLLGVFVTNLTDEPTDMMLLKVTYDTVAFDFQRLIITALDGTERSLPADSVLIFDRPGAVYVMIRPLGPHESTSFWLYGWGRPEWLEEAGKRPDQIQAIPAIVGAVGWWFITNLAQDVVRSFLVNLCQNLLFPDQPAPGGGPDFADAFWEAVDEAWQPYHDLPLAPAKKVAEWLIDTGLEHYGLRLPGPIDAAIQIGTGVMECLAPALDPFACAQNVCNDASSPEELAACAVSACPHPNPADGTRMGLRPIFSRDPNAKAGPAGRYLNTLERIPFTIFFENKAEATAPAYRIEIVDTLDGAFDPPTVRFEGASHEGWQFSRSGNVLRWVIEGIELPPNVNPPEGEGYVLFSVEPLPDLPTGTVIENRATIVFDMNKPLTTNTVHYVVDRTPPTSMPFALPETADSVLTLRWQAQDEGSGVAQVQVFASRDGRTFAPIATVPADRDTLQLKLEASGHYAFYTVAVDSAGNVQEEPSPVVETVVVSAETPVRLPEAFSLGAPYPHPAASWTWIPYSLPRRTHVRLALYDVTGRQVQVLFDGEQEDGYHQVLVRTRDLAAGLYFVRMEAPGGQQAVRLVVAR